MLRIKAKRNNFRRAGIAHPDKWTEYPDDAFTPEQIAALKAETMLIVQIVEPEPTEPEAGDEAGNDEISAMTVKQIVEEIAKYQPVEPLKGMKKAELIGILKAHIAAASGKKE